MNTPTHPSLSTPRAARAAARAAALSLALSLTLAVLLGIDSLASVEAGAALWAQAVAAVSV